MIVIERKEDCCGCTACESICPQNCIKMETDEEGFFYPMVSSNRCIDCNKCINVCPIKYSRNHTKVNEEKRIKKMDINFIIKKSANIPDCWIAFNKNDYIRENSTSGGLFTAFAEHILDKGGSVYGVIIDEDMNVVHDSTTKAEELESFRGSKYVQSNQVGIYKKVKNDLLTNKWVLYTGTPCQVNGLIRYLGNKHYEKLLTMDVICHGVGSPEYWKNYTDYITDKFKSKIKKVHFREKTYGYNSACLAVYLLNGSSCQKDHDNDFYWSAFSKCYIFRPSCYECEFKTCTHVSDFTVGDYWDSSNLPSKFKTAEGCSLLLVHTNKGKIILSQVSNKLEIKEEELRTALLVNGGHQPSMLIASSYKPTKRDEFMSDMKKLKIDQLINKYIPISRKQSLKGVLKPILYKSGLLPVLKKLK